MKDLEDQKLYDESRYENLGEKDPTPPVVTELLDIWREGEDKNYVSRDVCYEVVGLCEKKNGKSSV